MQSQSFADLLNSNISSLKLTSTVTWSFNGGKNNRLPYLTGVEGGLLIDTTVPKIDYSLSTTTFSVNPVIITITTTDNVSVSSITLPDGKVVSGATASFTVTQNGDYTFKFTDINGITITKVVHVSNIDTTKPTIEYSLSTSKYTNKPVTISVIGLDNVAIESVTLPDGTVVKGSTASFEVKENGDYVFTVTDTAGNSATKKVTVVNIDTTAPTIEYSLSKIQHDLKTSKH